MGGKCLRQYEGRVRQEEGPCGVTVAPLVAHGVTPGPLAAEAKPACGRYRGSVQRITLPFVAPVPEIVEDMACHQVHRLCKCFAGRRSQVDITGDHIDFAPIARGFGADSVTVRNREELDHALARTDHLNVATVVNVHVKRGEACQPMIVPSGAATEMLEWHASSPI